jgi:CRP/FNR family transcriptional regulator, cyclic AMP receptor protein
MSGSASQAQAASDAQSFNLWSYLGAPSTEKAFVTFQPSAVIFAQGDPCPCVIYIHDGAVKLSVVSQSGKEAIVAILGPGDFLGEASLSHNCLRLGTATALSQTTVAVVSKEEMQRLLREDPGFSSCFIEYMLARQLRIEEDLVDHLFSSSEKRLARTLLLLARYGLKDASEAVLPKLSQEALSEMIGTTRSRVNFFMTKFRKLGLIDYRSDSKGHRTLTVHTALLSVVLHEKAPPAQKKLRAPKRPA